MLRLANSRIFIGVILGALFIATLLFFLGNQQTETSTSDVGLKPSQLDFTQGNSPQASTETVEVTSTTISLKTPESFERLSAVDTAKIQTLDEVLKSKNDNDPRMDQEFKNMSAALHEALYDKYEMMAQEDRNGRGTVAFLIAREMKSQQDADFLKKVFNESPCTSMASCNQVSQEDSHLGGIEQSSLNYPQLATLYQIESRIQQNQNLLKDRSYMNWVSEILQQARQFPVPIVKDKAESLLKRYQVAFENQN